MGGRYHNGMAVLTARAGEGFHRVIDPLHLHRDRVVVPTDCTAEALAILQPDGMLLFGPPGGDLLELWMDGLVERLLARDLSRAARLGAEEPMGPLIGTDAPPSSGTPRYLEGGADWTLGREASPRSC